MIAIAGIVLVGGSAGFITWWVLSHGLEKDKKSKTPLFSTFKNNPFIYSISGFLLGWMLLNSIPAGGICAVIACFIPGKVKKWKNAKRDDELNSQLVDAIGIISSSLKAGFSLLQGIGTAAGRLPEPISGELKTVLKENRLGVSLEESLLSLGGRVKSDDFDLVITATLVSHETGGNITGVYERIVSTMRARNRMQLKLRTVTSQGKLQGIIIGILPVILILVLSRIAPDMIYPLFHTFAGILMLTGAVTLELIGVFFIKRITTVDM